MSIKAIETVYNGYRFRSRLEARWAVFFDALGVRYIYEREGFDLGEAGWYLPDFWLPDMNCWVEIKGFTDPGCGAKAAGLAKVTGNLVFMFSDCLPPEIKLIPQRDWTMENITEENCPDVFINKFGYYYAPDGDSDGMMAFGLCPHCNKVVIGYCGSHDIFCNEAYEIFKAECQITDPNTTHPRLIAAYTAARQARFEHGQTPRPTTETVVNKPKRKAKKQRTARQVPRIDPYVQEVYRQLVRGNRVRHPMFGDGVIEIESRDNSPVWIKFDNVLPSGRFDGWFAPSANLQKIEDTGKP